MSSSASCSTSRRAALVCAATIGLACAGRGRAPAPAGVDLRSRIAVFPAAALAGPGTPVRPVRGAVAGALRAAGVDVVGEEELEAFLARHRVRDTTGIDGPTAQAIREELGVAAVVIGSVDLYVPGSTPSLAMTLRLVATEDEPTIVWMDSWARAGNESPGLFETGVISDVDVLRRSAVADLSRSLAALLAEGRAPDRCASEGRLRPTVRFHQSLRPTQEPPRIAVLPFHNESPRPDAGEIASLQLVKHLVASGRFRILEPGIIRSELLRNRVVMEGGVTYEAARTTLATQRVDVVVGGKVFALGDQLDVTALAIETWENRLVWESRSTAPRVPAMVLFGVGERGTSDAALCRMVRAIADGMVRAWEPAPGRPASPSGAAGAGAAPERRRFQSEPERATLAYPASSPSTPETEERL